MKFWYIVCVIVLIACNVRITLASKSSVLSSQNQMNPLQNTNIIIKRSHSNKKNRDCRYRSCSLVLKKCPKACPQSCGYLNSPDPCCPLLGRPTCPDY